ncbi:MAG: phosphoribosylglycinamide formyltransferase [Pseudomonadota bacterium]|nr:phosphoribosylglycinamide formyltransferase [Pseudomonadota bacterium]
MAERARVAILISGRGSNMAALIYAAKADDCPFEVVLVTGDRPDAPGLAIAEAEGVPVVPLARSSAMDKAAYFEALDETLGSAGAAFIALAGFMRIIPAEFIERWSGRIVNVHPSLLPKYRGLDTHRQAIAAGDLFAGCSVHVVTSDVDAGPVLGSTEVAILHGDTSETLAERVLIAEHQLYPRVLAQYVQRERSGDWLLAQVRERALALPESEERPSHGSPAFFVKGGKAFAYFSANHHGEDRIALLVKISGVDEQVMLIQNNPEIYFRPAYFGDGWIGIRLDRGVREWDGVEDWLARSWRAAAPKRLAALPF